MCTMVALMLGSALMAALILVEAVVSRLDRTYRLPTIGV